MFKKKIKCGCGKKIDSKFTFCPYCGAQLKAIKEHEKDLKTMEKSFEEAFKMPFFVRLPFKKLIREMDQQFREMDKVIGERKKTEKTDLKKMPVRVQGISIKIETSPEGQPVIKLGQFVPGKKIIPLRIKPGEDKKEKEQEIKLPTKKLTKIQKVKLKKLPRKEPETSVRRLTDKIIYEIILPGVKSEKDIIINKLENSIEIKAFAKDTAYLKLIPIALPIKNYYLENNKLILELKP